MNNTQTTNRWEGKTLDQVIEYFYGNLDRWPIEPDGHNWIQSEIKAICQHILETGDCLWHAQSVVKKFTTCACSDCEYGPTIFDHDTLLEKMAARRARQIEEKNARMDRLVASRKMGRRRR
jgi:hypothetical protein